MVIGNRSHWNWKLEHINGNWPIAGDWTWTSLRDKRTTRGPALGGSPHFWEFYPRELHQLLTVKIRDKSPGASGKGRKKVTIMEYSHGILLSFAKTSLQGKPLCWNLPDIYPACALRLPSTAPANNQDQLPLLTITPMSQMTSPFIFCLTAAQRGLSHQCHVPFSNLSQQEIGTNSLFVQITFKVSPKVSGVNSPSPKGEH